MHSLQFCGERDNGRRSHRGHRTVAVVLLFLFAQCFIASAAIADTCQQINICPDLNPTGLSCSRDGRKFTISFTIRNLDANITADTDFQVYIELWNQTDASDCNTPKWPAYLNVTDDIPGGGSVQKSVTIEVAIGCEDYQCCGVNVDINDAVDEDSEANNSQNTNLIMGDLVYGAWTGMEGMLTNISATTTITVDNTVEWNPPAGWSVAVDPPTSTIAAGGTSPITLYYFAPPGAQAPVTIPVVSVAREIPFTQTNDFVLTGPVSVQPMTWGRVRMLYR